MNTILIDVLTYSIIIAFVLFITGILFIYNTYRYNKIIISIFCILSAFIIIYYDNKFRGYPMQPDPGEYRVQGWEVDESNNEIFIMAIPKNKTPRNFVIPFDLKNALFLQEASENTGTYKSMTIKISKNNDNNNLEYKFIFIKRFEDTINNDVIEVDTNEIINDDTLIKEKEILNNYPKPNN